VVLEYPAESGWELTKDTPKPEETTESFHRFRVPVEAGKTAQLTVESVHPKETRYALTNLNSDEVALLARQQRLTPALQQALQRILDQKNVIGGLQSALASRQQELSAINGDQARIRENMKALKGSAEEKALLQRYTKQLDSQEDRLSTLNKEIADLQQKQAQEQQKLDDMVQQVALDESF
jgi:chromosome segregation ATPase